MTDRFHLQAERLNRGLSRREAARQIGVPRETLRRLETGVGASPENAKKVADFFGVRVTDILPIQDVAA